MTLQEKFREVLKNHFQKNKEEDLLLSLVDEDNEKIADDYAIGFSDWIRVCKLKGRSYDFDNIEELLTIYKEEKEL